MKSKISFSAYSSREFCAVFAAALFAVSGCAGTRIHESTGEGIDDGAITVKVKTALLDHKHVSARDVRVETFKGTVQLSGFVKSEDEKQRAEELAMSVGGVKSVINGLVVE